MKKINVAQVVNQLSLGGTEKTLEIFARYLDKNLFKVFIFATKSGGDRYKQLKDSFPTFILDENKQKFVNLLKESNIDILHVHRSGSAEPFVLEAAREAGVPIVVETNVFGQTDKSRSAKIIDLSIFISQMCALRYIKKNRLSVEYFFKNNRVLYNPLDFNEFKSLSCSKEEIADFKNKLGITEKTPLIGRLSRRDPFKFGDICLKMLPYLAQEIPNFKYLIVGLLDEKKKLIKKLGVGKYLIELPFTKDKKELAKIYQSLDILAYASQHGESFGYVIAEAMAFGKPAVVNSTSDLDNAQVELVDHARTGFTAHSPRSYAKAVAYLLKNKTAREKMGQAGQQKASRLFDAPRLTRQLEKIYLDLCFKKGLMDSLLPQQGQKFDINAQELSAFELDYQLRIRMDFGRPYNQNKITRFFFSLFLKPEEAEAVTCPICNLTGVELFTGPKKYKFQICPGCGLVFRKHRSSKKYKVEKSYQEYIGRESELYEHFSGIISHIQKHKTTGNFFDIGCNYGLLMKVAADKGFAVAGTELSRPSAEFGRKRFGFTIHNKLFEEIGLTKNSLDVVTMNHLLEHTRKPVNLLQEVGRVLKDNGLVLIGLPNFGCRECQLDPAGWKYLRGEEHNWQFSPETLSLALNKAGFKIIDTPELTDNLVVIAKKDK